MIETLTSISAQDLKEAMASDTPPIVINVLGRDAHRAKHIPGSINVPLDDIGTAEDVLPSKDEHVVVYCANADCDASPKAARKLEAMGYTHVSDFEAGYAGWRNAGFPLVGEEA